MLQMLKQSSPYTYSKAKKEAGIRKMPLGHFIADCVQRYFEEEERRGREI